MGAVCSGREMKRTIQTVLIIIASIIISVPLARVIVTSTMAALMEKSTLSFESNICCLCIFSWNIIALFSTKQCKMLLWTHYKRHGWGRSSMCAHCIKTRRWLQSCNTKSLKQNCLDFERETNVREIHMHFAHDVFAERVKPLKHFFNLVSLTSECLECCEKK